MSRIFADQPTVFKINFAFGFILRKTETGALQYHHPSANNNLVLEQPFLISSPDDLERLYQQIAEIDYLEWVRQQRPNSKWVVDLVTNVTWFVWKIRDHPIGRGKYLPSYIVGNMEITPLDRDIRRNKPWEDYLCFFRCLALHNGFHTKNLERDTQYYYRRNSKWVVDLVTNVTWFVWKIRDHPIGRGKYLPSYIVGNMEITPLDRDIRRNKPWEDYLCFFRCLALHNGFHTKNLERDTQYYYQQYRDAGLSKKKFHGVKLSEVDELEKMYEVNIQV